MTPDAHKILSTTFEWKVPVSSSPTRTLPRLRRRFSTSPTLYSGIKSMVRLEPIFSLPRAISLDILNTAMPLTPKSLKSTSPTSYLAPHLTPAFTLTPDKPLIGSLFVLIGTRAGVNSRLVCPRAVKRLLLFLPKVAFEPVASTTLSAVKEKDLVCPSTFVTPPTV